MSNSPFHRDSSRMKIPKNEFFPSIYPPQILMVCTYMIKKMVSQTKILSISNVKYNKSPKAELLREGIIFCHQFIFQSNFIRKIEN